VKFEGGRERTAVFPAERLHKLAQECNELVAILTASVKWFKEQLNDR